ncbi:hypothetical protein A3K73_09060 [Candidatus Pacearchaeota archaeon RBG_13_36_9]|nr:MAG: hypothetical protein A3K73_09060 [Candidatus Pacearchaeota archaeon RBG_13_36_9]
MGKAAGYSGGRAISPAGGVGKGHGFGKMPNAAYSGGGIDLFKGWEEMRGDKGGYEAGHKRLRPYERVGPLETAAYATMASVDYTGKHRASYFAGVARGADRGYGKPVKGDAYQRSIIDLAAYRASMLDNAYRKTSGEGYQPNFEYSQAA